MRMGLTRLKKLRDHLGMLNTALTRHHIGWQMCYVQGAVLSTVDSRRGSVHVNLIKWYINQIKCYQNDVFLRPKPIRILLRYKIVIFSHSIVYDHTTLNTPVLVRSPKLSMVGPGQYLDGWPPGNTWCRRHQSFSFARRFIFVFLGFFPLFFIFPSDFLYEFWLKNWTRIFSQFFHISNWAISNWILCRNFGVKLWKSSAICRNIWWTTVLIRIFQLGPSCIV